VGSWTGGDLAIPKTSKADDETKGLAVTGIGNEAFAFCEILTGITIPDSVKNIDEMAFSNCICLESASIGDSVTSIGSYAFYGCSSLASISFAGTTTEWESVVKGSGWYYGVTATTVHCSDEDVAVPQQEDES